MKLSKTRKAAMRIVAMLDGLDEDQQINFIMDVIEGNEPIIDEFAEAYDEGNS